MSEDLNIFEDKPINAVKLTEEAEQRALGIYYEFFSDRYITGCFPAYKCILPDDVFIKILNDFITLSYQKIEERLISTKIIFLSNKIEKLEWPLGFRWIPIKEKKFNSISLTNLKRFIEIASDPNSYLVINFARDKDKAISFCFKGFVFIEISLKYFMSKREYLDFTMDDGVNIGSDTRRFKNKLKCLTNSVICSIEHSDIHLFYFNKKFLKISKGMLIEPITCLLDVGYIPLFSKNFSQKLDDIISDIVITEEVFGLRGLFDYMDANWDKKTHAKANRYHNIEIHLNNSLSDTILKISEAHHGSTLIFGYSGDLNDEDLFQPDSVELNIPYGNTLLKLTDVEDENIDTLTEIETYENAIISLSKTDGAMIFDSDLTLRSIGTFIKYKASATSSLMGGARLKSAEAFVRDNNDTIAFVISQDGSIHFIQKKYTIKQLREINNKSSLEYKITHRQFSK